jgi:hypothetical protein
MIPLQRYIQQVPDLKQILLWIVSTILVLLITSLNVVAVCFKKITTLIPEIG